MRRIFAIALISVRNAIRSRIVLMLLFFLLLTLIGLPLTVKGDGTLAGHVRLLLRYTLGLATLILSVATVWSSCAAFATEIRDRQIQMVICKPIHTTQLWLGKWLGLTVMNGGLLLLCACATYGALRWTTRDSVLSEADRETLHAEILVAQRRVKPEPVDLHDDIVREYEAARARGQWDPDTPSREIWRHVEQQVRLRAHAVRPGAQQRWTFRVPRTLDPARPLILRYRLSSSVLDMEAVEGVWTTGTPDQIRRHREPVRTTPRVWETIAIPLEQLAPDGTLTLEFANTHPRPITVLFDPDDDLRLMVYQGGFLLNYLRAILLIWFHLAFLAAIGLTASAFFSIPVAALSSFYALIILHAGRFINRMAEQGMTPPSGTDPGLPGRLITAVTQAIYRALDFVIQPVHATHPLDFVAVGEWVGWGDVTYMGVVKVLLYSGLLMGAGVWHLAHKEVANPA